MVSDIKALSIFVIHYSKLTNRKKNLTSALLRAGISTTWITESDHHVFKKSDSSVCKIFGISAKIVGMDLGINSRSLVYSRRTARWQGYILYLRSFISKRPNTLTTGSLPERKTLPNAWLELQDMHLTALFMGVASTSKWILVLEDDAVPTQKAFEKLESIVQEVKPNNVWINLNDGAGLKRTSSDQQPNELGLFRVRPAATRCATAYLVSADLARGLLNLVEEFGMPDWLPIDLAYQAAFRRLKCRAYWQEPVIFVQGSEGGQYQSNFHRD
jgi:hypothetical protein